MIPRHKAILLVAGFLVLVAIFSLNAVAASPPQQDPEFALFVTTTEDHNDGFCNGDCSLREAIIAANKTESVDGIFLPSGTYRLTLEGSGEDDGLTGDLDITSALTIVGDSPETTIIDASGLTVNPDRVLDIDPTGSGGYTVNLWSVTITGGHATGANGGGVRNRAASVTLYGCVISGNSADQDGGGIYNGSGALSVESSTISENSTESDGGGISCPSGALNVESSTISGNSADQDGGGIYNGSRALSVANSTISGNSACDDGGGIYCPSGALNVESSTISGNSAERDGGGTYADHLNLDNSTISGNSTEILGGGIYVHSLDADNSTISENSSMWGGGIFGMYPGIIWLRNTIVAMNLSGGDCVWDLSSVASFGHNLDSDNTCRLLAESDLPLTDPRLGPLQDNGGPTLTHALLFGSPAIDSGDSSDCPATDQRGFTRPMDGDGDGTATCDIGAFEHLGLRARFPLMFSSIGPSP
jgi:CSLREA domain-containing protein